MAEVEVQRREELKPSAALHLAGFLTLFSAILAVNSIVEVTTFVTSAIAVAVVGHLISYYLRRKGYTLRLLEIVVIGVVVLIYARVATGGYAGEALMPSVADDAMEIKLAVLLLWMEVFRSFTLTTDYAVVFTAVPSIALLGLMATENVNPEMLMFFVMYLVCAVFMLVHRASSEVKHLCGDESKLLWEQLKAALAVGAVAMVAGTIVVTPIRVAALGVFSKAAPGWLRQGQRAGFQNIAEPGMLPIAQGPVRLSSATVMIVKSKPPGKLTGRRYPLYWRGRVFERYTGHGWSSLATYTEVKATSKNGKPVQVKGKSGAYYHEFKGLDIKGKNIGEMELLFEVYRPTFSVVYTTAEVKSIRARADLLWRDSRNNWRGRLAPGYPMRYEVVSVIPDQDSERLRKIELEDYPKDVVKLYTQRNNSTVHAGELAHRVTEGLKTPYEKAAAIAGYLSSSYTYDINAAPAPFNTDAVEHFLFNTRTGYCDVFASAMVVMLRELGIPSRLATGFAEGEYDPSVHGIRVRELDKHAWVEVYFPQHGWIMFDPTGGSIEEKETWYSSIMRAASGSVRMLASSGMVTLAILLVLITAMLFVVSGGGLNRFNTRRSHHAGYASPDKMHQYAVREFGKLLRQLEKKGIRRSPSVTPREYAQIATEQLGNAEIAGVISSAVERFNNIRYGSGEDVAAELQALRSDLKLLKHLIRLHR